MVEALTGHCLHLWMGVCNEANVVITPGAGFGAAGDGFFRISAFSRANAEEVARRIAAMKW